jgi:hypothetical protein
MSRRSRVVVETMHGQRSDGGERGSAGRPVMTN